MVWKKSDDPPAHHPDPTPAVPPRPATPAPAPAAGPPSSYEQPRRTDFRARKTW